MNGDNVVVRGDGSRLCRECRNIRQRNYLAGKTKKKLKGGPTHCPKGHKYTVANIRWKQRGKYTVKQCRECQIIQGRKRYWRDPVTARSNARISRKRNYAEIMARLKYRLATDPEFAARHAENRRRLQGNWRKKNRSDYNAKQRRWRRENPDKVAVYLGRNRKFRELNKDALNARAKEKRKAMTAEQRLADSAKKRAYYERNRDRLKKYSRDYYNEHRRARITYQQAYVKQGPEVIRVKKREYQRRLSAEGRRRIYDARYKAKGGERVKEQIRASAKRSSVNLTDTYVRSMMKQAGYAGPALTDPKMIRMYRMNLKLKRTVHART